MALLKNMTPMVSVCIPFGRNPLPYWAVSLASINPPMNAMQQLACKINMKRDLAREELAEDSVKAGSKFMLFLDDDVTVPPAITRKLLYAFSNAPDDVMVIGGIYCTKTDPPIPLVFQKAMEGPYYKWKLGEVFECEIVATGMMMIRTEVFQHLSKPWFKDVDGVEEGRKYNLIGADYLGDNFSINDDGFFCHKVREAGFKVMAHGGVLGMHWDDNGGIYMLPDDAYPIMAEMRRKWGTQNRPPTDAEHLNLYKSIVQEYYGNYDFLPLAEPVAV